MAKSALLWDAPIRNAAINTHTHTHTHTHRSQEAFALCTSFAQPAQVRLLEFLPDSDSESPARRRAQRRAVAARTATATPLRNVG